MKTLIKSNINFKLLTAGIFFSTLISGCSSFSMPDLNLNKLPIGMKVHKIDIQQGNQITEEQLNKIQVGMSQNQTKIILGDPVLTDIFHKNRWDYPYYLIKSGIKTESKTLTLIFDENNLIKEIIK